MSSHTPDIDRPSINPFSDLGTPPVAGGSRFAWIGNAFRAFGSPSGSVPAIGLVVLGVVVVLTGLNSESVYARLAAPVVLAGIALAWCSWQTIVDPRWLALALTIEETIPYINLIPLDPQSRWFLRYPLLIAFCIPAVPKVWKSGILKRGHLPLFLVYFAWAAVSVLYSDDPATSAGRLLPAFLVFASAVLIASLVNDAEDVTLVLSRFFCGCSFFTGLAFLTATVFPQKVLMEGEESIPIGVYNWVSDQSSGILRFSGYSYVPNDIGALMLVTVGVGIVLWPRYRGMRRVAITMVMLAAIIFAGMADSRSPFVALAVGTVGFLVWKYRFRGAAVVLALGLLTLGAYGIYGLGSKAAITRDVTTLTGRTEAWRFEIGKIAERPLTGYGYSVEGEIFQDRYFPNWEKFWDLGANTSLHNSYMSVIVGLGIPALVLFLYLAIAPWISLFRRDDDPWMLKPLFFFVILPAFVLGLDETGLADPRYLKGTIFFICWALAERQRVEADEARRGDVVSSGSNIFTINARVALIFLTTILLGSAARASAADFYVDATMGNDNYSGKSQSAAWRSLAHVNHFAFEPGDSVHLARGSVWREELKPAANGDSNFRGITFTAYGSGELPTINGADLVNGWSRSEGNVYSVPQSQQVYNVFVDGQPGWGLSHACCTSSGSCAPASPKAYIKGQTCSLGPMQAGSWYWSGSGNSTFGAAGTLYVWLPDGGDVSNHSVEVVTRPYGIVANASRGALDGLTLDHLQIVQTGLRGMSLQSQDEAGCCGSRGIGIGSGIRNLVIRNCVVKRTGTGIIDDGSYGNAITLINATAPIVQDNIVSYAGNHGNDINVQNSNGARVLGNHVDHWNHNGIDIKGSRDVIVEGNVAQDQPRAGAGYYTEFSENVLFRNNQAINVSNGFQISVGATASVVNNSIRSAATVIFFGPRSVSLTANDNAASSCKTPIGRDGSGRLMQANNNWRQ